MKSKTITCSVVALFALCASGVEYSNWNPDGSGSWGSASRWTSDSPLPTERDRSVFITDADAFVTEADYTILTNLVRLRFSGTSSLDMRFNEDHLGFSLNNVQNDSTAQPYGTLIKSGTGLLVDSTPNTKFKLMRYMVTNGVLRIDYASPTGVLFNVCSPGVLAFNQHSYVSGLEGDGLVTNTAGYQIHFNGGLRTKPTLFDGVLGKNANPTFDAGCQYFTTSACDSDLTVRIKDGFAGVKYFGAASGIGGSLGSNKNFCHFQGTGGIVYIGNGETTSKTLTFAADCQSATIDAGANGGVTFTGDCEAAKCPRVYPLNLEGSNTVRCVFSGDLTGNATNAAAIVKRGSGIWSFSNRARDNIGSVTVEDGTLEYGSMAEAGTACSLGKSERLTEPATGLLANLPSVPWAFRLGTHSTTGVFAYVGSDDVACTSRLFAVRGTGVVRSDTSATLFYDGATSYDAQGGTLVLEGSGNYDYFANVTNGVGPLSVEKCGTGTWTLGRDIDLASVSVKGGTLRLANSRQYRWYRFTVKRLWSDSNGELQLSQFGLYNASGVQQNLNLTENVDAIGKTYILDGGKCGWNHSRTYDNERVIEGLFAGTDGVMGAYQGSMKPAVADPATWLCFTMCVADNAGPIKYYGVKSSQGSSDKGLTNREREPRVWMLEGSVDGRYWDFLDAQENLTVPDKGQYWYHTGSKDFDASNPGFVIADEAPARTVRIGSVLLEGGTLVADAPVVVSNLVVDAVSGGILNGFDFARSGTLGVRNLPRVDNALELPVSFANCTGLENINQWTLSVGGSPCKRFVIRSANGKITIVRRGFVLVYK